MNVLVVGNGQMGTVVYKELIERGDSVTIVPDLKRATEAATGQFDVLIDFSHPEGIESIVTFSKANQVPAVIATTGYTDAQFEWINSLSQEVPVLYSGNYSLGIILMERLVREAAHVLGSDFDIEIIEKHHHHKIDAPSGTAKMLLHAANEQLDYQVIYGREGICKRNEKEIAVHTIRGGSIVGEHEVLFAGADEILSIKHEALSKAIFAKGAIKGAQWLSDQAVGLYNMEDVLFGKKD
ncbi:MAG: 4-hydroxy-tetrahydrodipicolinate reductase [Defluviitaleaceae bacterium]|nr:4-hydroxy-tetrahydrodipicolinate reductase [Defluviitaleaceae bacterium]